MSLLQIHEPNASPEPHSRSAAVGIDLGTTHSVVAVVRDEAPIAIEDAQGRNIIPSVVAYAEGKAHVGMAAKTITPAIHSIKRWMGKNAAEAAASHPHLRPYLKNETDDVPTLVLDGREHTPISISADILSHMKVLAETALGEAVTQAVITVPAYFDDAARHATRQAAELAGLEVLRLINEPTAAAMAYGLEHGAEGLYAMYDLGGGTFDISILRLEQGVFQVLATSGDTALGGDDVDSAITEHLCARFHLQAPPSTLLSTARFLKEQLSEKDVAETTIDGIAISLSTAELNSIAAPFIQRTLNICTQALSDAGMNSAELNGVVLVGGSTRLHAVQRAVAEFFACPVYSNLDPDRVVAYGAALQAHALTEGSEHLLLDVTPLSLGLETMGDIVEKIIYRNTPIPATAAQEFTTYQDGQTGMQIHVLQGERELVEQCRSLARFELTGIPPMPAGMARVEVRFTIDADGLLVVSAEEKTTGIRQTVQVKPSYGLPIEQIEAMIRDSMAHGKEDMLARMLIEARIEAQRTLEELRSALSQDAALVEEADRTRLHTAMQTLQDAISTASRDALNDAHDALKRASAPFAEARMNQAITKALAGQRVGDV
jgi:molecular chaperone HscA